MAIVAIQDALRKLLYTDDNCTIISVVTEPLSHAHHISHNCRINESQAPIVIQGKGQRGRSGILVSFCLSGLLNSYN